MRILLSAPNLSAKQKVKKFYPAAQAASCAQIDALAELIASFLRGEDICFSLNLLRLDLCSAFQRSVLRAEYRVPRGKVTTYGAIARHLKRPAAARAVGTALACNPFPIIIPCHRVIRSDGRLGSYQGGERMKRALLEMEGISTKGGIAYPSCCIYNV